MPLPQRGSSETWKAGPAFAEEAGEAEVLVAGVGCAALAGAVAEAAGAVPPPPFVTKYTPPARPTAATAATAMSVPERLGVAAAAGMETDATPVVLFGA